MRISDWSSDVCSSDLKPPQEPAKTPTPKKDEPEAPPKPVPTEAQQQAQARAVAKHSGLLAMTDQLAELREQSLPGSTEERRGGTGGVGTWKSRWSPDHSKQKQNARGRRHQSTL